MRAHRTADRHTTVDVLGSRSLRDSQQLLPWPSAKTTTARPTFNGMEALVCMAVAVLMVVVVDGVMLVQTHRHG